MSPLTSRLITDACEKFRLSDHLGHPVVLYFYPQDDTEGCTLENIEFTDLMPQFKKLGAVVVGISPDYGSKSTARSATSSISASRWRPISGAQRPSRPGGIWQLKKLLGAPSSWA